MTDLVPEERSRLMMMVCKTEQVIRDVMRPDKINLASLGNVVPHLHWHVIPRFCGRPAFPESGMGRETEGETSHAVPADLDAQLAAAFNSLV